MEELKPLSQLEEPDERQLYFVVRETPAGPTRPLRAEDIHGMAARAQLHAGVPEHLRSHFAMAQNLLAYSWYCYSFNVAAELHAYISVELALRTRLSAPTSRNFQSLLKEAMDLGLIKSAAFTYGRNPSWQSEISDHQPSLKDTQVLDYVAAITEAMRSLRNGLAHGSNVLHGKGDTVLLVCSELINQLFELPTA